MISASQDREFCSGVSDSPRTRLAATLEMVAAGHLLLPATLTAVALAGFMVGHRLAAWVLLLATLVAVFGLRAFCASWRETGRIGALAAVVHIIAAALAVLFPDASWDGLVYHQEGVLRLADGWNPLYEDAARYGLGNELPINHYPKLPWINAAAVLLSTGYVEAGKLFNLTLMVAAGAQATSALLRVTRLSVAAATAVTLIAVLNPVFLYQSLTFYVDGAIASLLMILVAGIASFADAPRLRPLAIAVIAASIAINLKFTGLAYAGVLLCLAVPMVSWWRGFRAGFQMTVAGATVFVLGILLLGYTPYVRNTLEKGNPVYAAPQADVAQVRPVNMNDHNRFMRYLISSFSRTDVVRAPQSTRLKFPLWIGPEERRGAYGADLESGGFGPWYGLMLILAAAAGVALLSHPATRARGATALLIGACLVASSLVHVETWWARYVAHLWLLPLLVAVASLDSNGRRAASWLGRSILVVATVNLLIVAANVGWNRLTYLRVHRASMMEMAAAPQPVNVYLGPFRPMRQRLLEAGIRFTIVDEPPATGFERHPLPVPGGGAFWFARTAGSPPAAPPPESEQTMPGRALPAAQGGGQR